MKAGPFCMVSSAALAILKLGGAIAWPWWLVLAPVWGWLAVLILSLAVIGLCEVMRDRMGDGAATGSDRR